MPRPTPRVAVTAMVLIAGSLCPIARAQHVVGKDAVGLWALLDRMPDGVTAEQPWVRTDKFAPAQLDFVALGRFLAGAPLDGAAGAANPLKLWLPMPDGTFALFDVVEAPIMEAPLAARFPEIRTYRGHGVTDRYATVRLDHTPLGFHAQILSPGGAVYIDPYSRGDNDYYTVCYKRDYTKQPDGWTCGVTDRFQRPGGGSVTDNTSNGVTLRTYRLACAADGEYTAFFGGTVAAGQSAVVTAVNRVDGVYETELSIRMVLVANNSSIIYTNASTDPYTNTSGGTMLSQNQTTCDSVIGTANYDIGHVFSTGGGGIAGLGVVGVSGNKARGVTGSGSPTGDAFWIDYVAHEMGHQYGANHTFNSSASSCGGGNRSASHAYEVGSGSTIMAYAGICGSDDLQPHSDPYFVWDSLNAISSYVSSGAGVGNTQTATGNSIPAVNPGTNYTIPANTPYLLTGSATDTNNDPLTYCWEEADLGVSTTLGAADNGTSPLQRSWSPTTSPSRTLPRLANLLNNTPSTSEVMPSFNNRFLNYTLTVRDNRTDGAFAYASIRLTVVNTGAAFAVTSPNTSGITWTGNSIQPVTWNVAGTTGSGINCANVQILLSTDGGNTYPTTLLAGTPNNGSANITVPNINTSTARVKVAAVGNIFFDISNFNVTINQAAVPPANNDCANATAVSDGNTPYTTVNATTDGPSEPNCGFGGAAQVNQDVWFTYTASCTGQAFAGVCGSSFDTRMAVYSGAGCPGSPGTCIVCDDDFCGDLFNSSQVDWACTAGSVYKIRIGAKASGVTGTGMLNVSCAPGAPVCYANCDGSTTAPVVNTADFTCFLQQYSAAIQLSEPEQQAHYANCDGSTTFPEVNTADFTCFLQKYAAGCT